MRQLTQKMQVVSSCTDDSPRTEGLDQIQGGMLGLLSGNVAPEQISLFDWSRMMSAARLTGVWSRIAWRIVQQEELDRVPEEIQWHIHSQNIRTAWRTKQIRCELERLEISFQQFSGPVVLLKGGAYAYANLSPSAGRIYSDIDLLVAKNDLQSAEQVLTALGWEIMDLSEKHQRYYRSWLHEIPPMRHRFRKTELDLHHNLQPSSHCLAIDPLKTIDASQFVSGKSRTLRILSKTDLILHSASHLFLLGDFTHGLRDLHDLDLLLNEFSTQTGFWESLVDRAIELNLQTPCWLALRFTQMYFATPIPEIVTDRMGSLAPGKWVQRFFDRYVPRALFPERLDGDDFRRQRAIWFLAHYPLPSWKVMVDPLFWLKRVPFDLG